MSKNNSSNSTNGVVVDTDDANDEWEDWKEFDMMVKIGYIVGGTLMVVGGAGVWLPVMFHRALRIRKEYLFIAALTFADSINGK